ncbi:MAG: RluA family pseudouridine synthase [Candidatus Omnitrophota bacterium]
MNSEKKEIFISEEEKGLRLDKLLTSKFPDESRTHLKRMIEDGRVTVNGEVYKTSHKVQAGEKIEIKEIQPVLIDLKPQKMDLEILYEDDDILVINKPAGLLVHPAGKRCENTLANALVYHFGKLPSLGDEYRLGIVHRLDEGTSGLMIIAKTEHALRKISDQFKERVVKKEYTALVKGIIQADEGAVDAPIGRHYKKRQRMMVKYVSSREAETYWKVTERFKESTLVTLMPKTGRTHQIRVHMSYLGHPILGDKEYGIKAPPLTHQALCATYIGFYHPQKKEFIEFKIDLPEDFKKQIEIEKSK